jgi:hypothetical protein
MKISAEQRRNTEAVALVTNSVGQMVPPKRADRKYVLDEAIGLVADKFKAIRERKANDSKQPKGVFEVILVGEKVVCRAQVEWQLQGAHQFKAASDVFHNTLVKEIEIAG